ncbi:MULTISPECIES: LLM class flavin-dependent oxidoreductase [Kocuria]|uniref:LLM class flavin-dependent oxidoreductase n=1 Tax=Kocuria TaxID=57493 RepID=UPI00065FE99C|nr:MULTISPECIES: LLM class flavin-dependent oxidoreductase [Kocuria]RUQ22683.1 LLM class flavin-dependent oxidoreductase [Kocuria sp. HSID16901]
MPVEPRSLKRLGFLHIAPFSADDPGTGLRDAIDLFRYAEFLGFDSGWLRTRHMQYGVTAPGVMLGALSQATERIQLGNAVIPMEFENPLSLAEDLGVADLLSGGRLRPGLSVHPPSFDDDVKDVVFGPGWRYEDYGYDRIHRLVSLLRGEKVRDLGEYQGFGGDFDSETVQPLSPGLADRLSYGAGSLRSARWAGQSGLGLLVSNIGSTENGIRDFDEAQAAVIREYRSALAERRSGIAAQARVVVPTDETSPEQKVRYEEYVARRTPRTAKILGEKTIIAPDRIGSTEDIVEGLLGDPSFNLVDEFIVELPFELEPSDWRHILEQCANRIGPALGWRPAGER